MARQESPDGRRVHMNVRFSEAEAALVDAARGSRDRGAWLRAVALAALGIPESRNAGGTGIPVVVSDRQPPGTVTAASAGRGADGKARASAASAVNVTAEVPAPRPRKCRHPKVRVKGVCPDCTEYVASKP
jgi:hypothetical protein